MDVYMSACTSMTEGWLQEVWQVTVNGCIQWGLASYSVWFHTLLIPKWRCPSLPASSPKPTTIANAVGSDPDLVTYQHH